jgi:hypothetical protein
MGLAEHGVGQAMFRISGMGRLALKLLDEAEAEDREREERARTVRPRGKAKAMRAAANETTETGEPTEPIKPPPHPTYDEAVHREVMELKDLVRTAIPNATTSCALTSEDVRILTVLDACHGRAVTRREIIAESVRLEREDRAKMRRLAESTLYVRIPVLMNGGLVARPPGTKKKGVAITAQGSEALRLATANSTQTQGKN